MSIIEISKKRLEKADEVAIHYGFNFKKIEPSHTKNIPFLDSDEKISVIKNYRKELDIKKKVGPEFIYYDEPILINKNGAKKNKNEKILGLDIIGIQNSIAEAIIINTAMKILEEEGYQDTFIDINCMGDRSSVIKFKEELKNYYKKNLGVLENCCKNAIKKEILSVLKCQHKNCIPVKESAPRPINFLSEQSRNHLKEVIEYLEEMKIPYKINSDLISPKNHYTKTIFEIKTEINDKNNVEEIILARGGRYDDVANKVARKRNLSAVGVSMQYKINKNQKAYSNKISTPKIFLIQFGFKAKLKSLEVLEILRQEKITIHQNLHKERLTEQFDIAKELGIPYIFIIGQKEALDNEIIIKDILNTSQRTIKINKLPQYIRKMNLV